MLKVEEELRELKEASIKTDTAAIEEELGDLLFAVANLARFVSVCPEYALKKTTLENEFEQFKKEKKHLISNIKNELELLSPSEKNTR